MLLLLLAMVAANAAAVSAAEPDWPDPATQAVAVLGFAVAATLPVALVLVQAFTR